MTTKTRKAAILQLAREQWARDGEIEIDDAARISESEDADVEGAYVQAWVWVDFAGTPLGAPEDEPEIERCPECESELRRTDTGSLVCDPCGWSPGVLGERQPVQN